jgi:secondary thiamine-phosphate synthase enzyme
MAISETQRGTGLATEAGEAGNGAPVRVFHRVLDWLTSERFQLLNITERVQDVVRRSGIREGLVHIQSLHTTTGLLVNEWQEALLADIKRLLEELVGGDRDWRHNDPRHSDCERGNADAHLRGMLLGQTLCLQVRNAAVLLGSWQSIILAELDGPRSRQVAVQVLGV